MSDLFIAAVCALIRKHDRVLSMRRSMAKDAAPGIWEAMSGRIEHHESPLQAVRREIEEETGLVVRLDPRPLSAHHSLRNCEPMIILYYQAEWVSGEVRMSDEHDAWEWLDAATFAERTPIQPLAQAVRQILGR